MAEQGARVRVDANDGQGTVFNLNQSAAEKFIASHPGAKIIPTPPRRDPDAVPEGLRVEGVVGIEQMSLVELRAFAAQEGLSTEGRKAELRDRLAEHLAGAGVDANGGNAEEPAGNA